MWNLTLLTIAEDKASIKSQVSLFSTIMLILARNAAPLSKNLISGKSSRFLDSHRWQVISLNYSKRTAFVACFRTNVQQKKIHDWRWQFTSKYEMLFTAKMAQGIQETSWFLDMHH